MVRQHVVEVKIGDAERGDGNDLVGRRVIGKGKVIPHGTNSLVEDAGIEVLLLVGEPECLGV